MLEYDRIDMSEGIDVNKPMVRASVLFAITGIFLRYILDFSQKYVMITLMRIIIIITFKCF